MGYAGWLRNSVRDRNLPFHLELSDLGKGAGDPLARIDLAIERLKRLTRDREPFVSRFLLLDTDQLKADPNRAHLAKRRASDHDIIVIWQDPTHEAFLLRHFPGRENHRPPSKGAADLALAKEWADYRKASNPEQVERHLDLEGALRVAAQLAELASLLRAIGLDSPTCSRPIPRGMPRTGKKGQSDELHPWPQGVSFRVPIK
jgi:hypothetical protein